MTREEKELKIQEANKNLVNVYYTPLFAEIVCCICYNQLTADNIAEDENGLIDVCIKCNMEHL